MTANEAFTGIYSLKLRGLLSCLTGQELQIFMALVTYTNDMGTCWPGVRELSAVTTIPTSATSRILESLVQYHLVAVVRRDERDELTGKIKPNVYALSPEIVLVSNPEIWYRHNASITPSAPYIMPESTFPVKSAQPDRIKNQNLGTISSETESQPFENAATLENANTPHQPNSLGSLLAQYNIPNAVGNANASNSPAQRQTSSPSSDAPLLSFADGVIANAIRREVSDMSAETVRGLIKRFGVEQVTAAVSSFKKRNEKSRILRPTGWIIRNLESGAKRK